jgi:hypothetical protein
VSLIPSPLRRVAAQQAILALLAVVACGRGDTSGSSSSTPDNASSTGNGAATSGAPLEVAPQNAGGSGSATVTWKPDVHVIEQDKGYAALISVSTDGSTLVFDRSIANIPEMKAGDVFVVKGLLARKVVAAMTNGNELAVLTIPAALLDLVSDAKIHVESPIRFGRPRSAQATPTSHGPWQTLGDAVIPPLFAQSPTDVRRHAAEAKGRSDAFGNVVSSPFKAVLNGWETTFSATPAEGRLQLAMQLKKELANATAVIEGTGYLSDFDFSSDIGVERSQVEQVQLACSTASRGRPGPSRAPARTMAPIAWASCASGSPPRTRTRSG